MTNKKQYTFIDLFAGLGGFHLALQNLGCKCVFASELREDLQKLYRINYPGTTIEGDITKVKVEDIPSHDILCAGFPCQPFSQAGKRQGFNDEKDRGNLFNNICEIIEYHRPKYIILENVSNLKGHDEGNTWKVIHSRLYDELGYDIKEEILSPHQYGIAQHRKRIYIVGVDRQKGDLSKFDFLQKRKFTCDINKIIDEEDTDIIKLKKETREQLSVWQEFIDELTKRGKSIPQFPIWAMEFGATYDYIDLAPAFQDVSSLKGKRGKLGNKISGESLGACLEQLPIYAQTSRSRVFPKWKIRYISQNREFYKDNKDWLDKWLKKVSHYENSHLKLEWNCGNATPILKDKIIQFRASGIRVKLPTYSPALNLVGTQIPIFPWIKLPSSILKEGEPTEGRYMSVKEAAAIQGMSELFINYNSKTYPLSLTRIFEALGNAVNVTIVKHIAKKLLEI